MKCSADLKPIHRVFNEGLHPLRRAHTNLQLTCDQSAPGQADNVSSEVDAGSGSAPGQADQVISTLIHVRHL